MDNSVAQCSSDFFHKLGFYFSVPYSFNTGIESKTTLEEIQYTEGIADLQGQGCLQTLWGPIMVSSFRRRITCALVSKSSAKNVYVSFGAIASSKFHITYVLIMVFLD